MFKKIVSNLPFHPTLLGDLGYYLRRVKQEESIRRLGLVFVVLAMAVQIFAFVSPTKSSLATSTADIVYGATSKDDIVKAYNKNKDPQGRKDIREIFDYYGIGLDQIQNSKKTVIEDSDNEKYLNTSRSSSAPGGVFTRIPGAIDGGIYEFPLKYWDKSQFPDGYPALTGISTYGFRFWILLKGCGNIVIEKGSKHPNFEINKKLISAKTANQTDTVNYTIEFRNSGLANSENVRIVDKIDDNYKYIDYKSTADLKLSQEGQKLTWEIKGKDNVLSPSNRWHKIDVTLQIRKSTPNGSKLCNQVTIKGTRTSDVTSGGPRDCVTINTPTCPGTGLPIPSGGIQNCSVICPNGSTLPYNQSCPIPQLTCQSLKLISSPTWDSGKFETSFLKQPGGTVASVKYFVNDGLVATNAVTSNSSSDFYTHKFSAPGSYVIKAELVPGVGNLVPSQGCQTTVQIDKPINPVARIVTDKRVSNMTTNIEDANNSTASASDVLKYTLVIANTGDAPATNLELKGEYSESISDVLEYADLVEKGDAIFNENTQTLSWPAVTITAGGKVEKVFTVKVKNPIPATPISSSNPLSFDYSMRNKYGREVVVNLNKPASKTVEQSTAYLPNTGPGTGLMISVFATTLVAYFYYRSKLMSRELEVIRYEFSTGGL